MGVAITAIFVRVLYLIGSPSGRELRLCSYPSSYRLCDTRQNSPTKKLTRDYGTADPSAFNENNNEKTKNDP